MTQIDGRKILREIQLDLRGKRLQLNTRVVGGVTPVSSFFRPTMNFHFIFMESRCKDAGSSLYE